MKVHHDIVQGTEEWKALRRTVFTGSNLGDWLVEQPEFRWTKEQIGFALCLPDKEVRATKREDLVTKLPADLVAQESRYTKTRDEAWQNAIWSKLGELSQDEEPEKETWAMKRGRELEPIAREAYVQQVGFGVLEVGFISHDCEGFGVSPDGLVFAQDYCGPPANTVDLWSHGLEIKCPVAKTMMRWLDAGTLPDEHRLQVHASLAASGLQRWDFWAWHPELIPLHIIVERDDFTEQVLAGLLKLSDDYMEAKAKVSKWVIPTTEKP